MGNVVTSVYSSKLQRSQPDTSAEDDDEYSKADDLAVDERVFVLGSGNFGTCLADHLADMGIQVTMWSRDQTLADSINNEHKNSKYMKDVTLSTNLKATTEISGEMLGSTTVVLFAIPTQHMRSILERTKPFLTPNHLLIFCNKGIEQGTLLLPHDIVKEVLGEEMGERATFLSGPSFAAEVVQRQPSCVSVASKYRSRALRTQRLFHAPHFRVYDNPDVVGVEAAGALKNVVALASGACSGLGFQNNSRAALITRGLAEIARIGVKLGANPLTFAGL
ncbi:hypothetical protein HK102_002170, partial [Quaeritorhiza haematococci]